MTSATGFRLTDAEFERLREYFYKRTGIQFSPAKRYFVDKRIETCIKSSGHAHFSTWFAALRLGNRPEIGQELINQLTVNETYFLREDYQFDALLRSVLPRIIDDRRNAPMTPIRIMSLPCSTGEEPYSIAMHLLESWPPIHTFDVEIHAADIDSDVLARAQQGIYSERSVHRVPKTWMDSYFKRLSRDSYQISGDLRSAVTFHRLNITDTTQMRDFVNFDVIFCRNVLIYFDELSSRRAAENLYGALRPGGYLFLGHSESMSRISPIFDPVRFPEGIAYQRPTGAQR